MTQEQLFGIFRHVLTIAGGYLVAQGMLSEGALTEIVGGIMASVGVAWSWWSKPSAPAVEAPAETPKE